MNKCVFELFTCCKLQGVMPWCPKGGSARGKGKTAAACGGGLLAAKFEKKESSHVKTEPGAGADPSASLPFTAPSVQDANVMFLLRWAVNSGPTLSPHVILCSYVTHLAVSNCCAYNYNLAY